MNGKRLGLSFEVAQPAASNAYRTDIACFVGCISRRGAVLGAGPQLIPAPLARWFANAGWTRIGDVDINTVLLNVGNADDLRASMLAVVDATMGALPGGAVSRQLELVRQRAALVDFWRVLDTVALSALLASCAITSALPSGLLDDLRSRGFAPASLLGADAQPTAAELAPLVPTPKWRGKSEFVALRRMQMLFNLPVPLESFEQFDALFAWDERPCFDRTRQTADDVFSTAPLGAAVRAFFGEGGRKCYVIRTGDPFALFDAPADRFLALAGVAPYQRPQSARAMDASDRIAAVPGVKAQMLPPAPRAGTASAFDVVLTAVTPQFDPVPTDASLWCGIEHAYGLTDLSFICVPDVPDACAEPEPRFVPPADRLVVNVQFRECAAPLQVPAAAAGQRLPAPALQFEALEVWRSAVMHALRVLDNDGRAFNRRDIQLLASLPLAGNDSDMPQGADWLDWMNDHAWLSNGVTRPATASVPAMLLPALIDTRLQLGYPWLRTRDSDDCPGAIEAPEGTLAGLLARSALLQGSFRLAAHQRAMRVIDMQPVLDLGQATQSAVSTPIGEISLAERVCLIVPGAQGVELLTDVTCADDPLLRAGSVRRLLDVVIRAARSLGEEITFEPSGEALWAKLRTQMSDLGRVLRDAGALSSDAGTNAFVVRCGRNTMSQADVDAGRLIAEIELVPAQPVTRIVVSLALRDAQPAAAIAQAA